MAKQRQGRGGASEPSDARASRHYPQPRGGQGLAVATLIAVMGVLMISFSNWREIDRIEENIEGIEEKLGTSLGQIDTRLAQVSDKVDKLPAQAAQPARRGPDPNRVYTINTKGAPAKGPASAAVTIAEFSDFQ